MLYSRYRYQMFKGMWLGYSACERNHGLMVKRGLVEKDLELGGGEGSMKHMIMSSEKLLEAFVLADPRKVEF